MWYNVYKDNFIARGDFLANHRRADISDEEILRLWDLGMSVTAITKELDCSHALVTRRLADVGIKSDRHKGISRHYKQIHDSLWSDIKNDLDDGLSVNAITKKYNVSAESLNKMIKDHDYKYDLYAKQAEMLYSDEYKNQLIELKKTHTVPEIAKLLGKSVTTIRRHMGKFGITQSADRTDIQDEDVITDWNSGLTIIEIANKYQCSHDTITKRLNKYDIKCDRVSGIKKHFDRVHEDMWVDIKSDLDKGLVINTIVIKYNIGPDVIHRLIAKHRYPYKNYKLLDLDALQNRVSASSDNEELFYLNKIKEYHDVYSLIPVVAVFSEFLNKDREEVCYDLYKYQLTDFFNDTGGSIFVMNLVNFLNDQGVYYKLNDRKTLVTNDGLRREIDIYLENFNFGIEVNPVFTHSYDSIQPYGQYDKYYHQKKSLLAEEKGIGLLHVYDEDILDTNKHQVLLTQLKARFSEKIKLGARQCVIKKIDLIESNDFLQTYHFQGKEHGSFVKYGLYHNDMLLGVMTIGKSRYANTDYEIIRYCIRPDYIINGCFDKLFKTALKDLPKPCTIVSYMDLNKRFTADNTYEKHGFIFDGITVPDYVWVSASGKHTLSRYKTTKQQLVKQGFDENKSEIEIMRERKYFRVFRAGAKRYIYYSK